MTVVKIDKKYIKTILILEDDIERISWFHKILDGHFKVTYVDNAIDAIYLLNKNNYDFLMLDHDLGGEQMVDIKDENTGSRVADEIKKLGINVPTIIHSYNPNGVDNMLDLLPHAKALPFKTFDIEIINT